MHPPLHLYHCSSSTISTSLSLIICILYLSNRGVSSSLVSLPPLDGRRHSLSRTRLRSSSESRNNDSQNTSPALVLFETASRIVQHYLHSSDGDISSESWSSPTLLRRLTDDGDDDDDVINNNSNCWGEIMFAPIYGTTISLPSIYPSQFPNDEQRIQQRQHKERNRRTNLKLTIAYRGQDFCGWEDQRHSIPNDGRHSPPLQLPSVQGVLADILDPILGKNEQQYHGNETTITARRPFKIKVAGRTDAGVSAIGQICRVRTWRRPTTLRDGQSFEQFVKEYVNDHVAACVENDSHGATIPLPSLRVRSVECVDDNFHPTFGASCRAYAYLIDVDMLDDTSSRTRTDFWKNGMEVEEDRRCDGIPVERPMRRMSTTILVQRLNALLGELVGKELDYIALSYGKVKSETTLCTLHHARAQLVELLASNDASEKPQRAICIELVGDRFLRRMVRILVATAMREAYGGGVVRGSTAEEGEEEGDGCHLVDNALLSIILSKSRLKRAKAAPSDGLVFVGAAYH